MGTNSLFKRLLFILIAFIILGSRNDTILAANQIYVLIFFLIYVIYNNYRAGNLYVPLNQRNNKFLFLCCVILFWMAIGISYSLNEFLSLRFSIVFLMYILLIIFPISGEDYSCLFNYIRIVSIILAISIIISGIIGKPFIDMFSFWYNDYDRIIADIHYGQYSGLVGDRSFASMAMCTGVFSQLSVVMSNHKIKKFDVFLIGLYSIALMLTGKRITLLMIACGIIICLLFSNDKMAKRNIIKAMMTTLLIGLIALYAIPQTQILFDRIVSSLGDSTYNDRIRFWKVASEMFLSRPITGYGIGSFLTYNKLYGTGIEQYAHNMYFQFAAELGFIGTTLMISFFFYALYFAVKTLRLLNSYQLYVQDVKSEIRFSYFSILIQVGFFSLRVNWESIL